MSSNLTIIKLCEVVSVADNIDGGRIRARIVPDDDSISNENLPYAFPLLPKVFHVKPKVGESVLILASRPDDKASPRYYIGPIISQPNHMFFDSFIGESTSLYSGAVLEPEPAEHTKPKTRGCYPEDEEVAVVGRENSELRLREDKAELRCGVRLTNGYTRRNVVFNDDSPAYVQLNSSSDKVYGETKAKQFQSSANIIADRINLIGNRPLYSSDKYETTSENGDSHDLITPEEIEKFVNNAHAVPYGDELVSFLKKLINTFSTHTHPFPTFPPCQTTDVLELKGYNYNKMLSNTVRIN